MISTKEIKNMYLNCVYFYIVDGPLEIVFTEDPHYYYHCHYCSTVFSLCFFLFSLFSSTQTIYCHVCLVRDDNIFLLFFFSLKKIYSCKVHHEVARSKWSDTMDDGASRFFFRGKERAVLVFISVILSRRAASSCSHSCCISPLIHFHFTSMFFIRAPVVPLEPVPGSLSQSHAPKKIIMQGTQKNI